MPDACERCINRPYCEHRGQLELEKGCDDFVELMEER